MATACMNGFSMKISIKPLFAWYDMWMGVYWDRKSRRLYVMPLPCIGFVVEVQS